jgi:hypothetical protein
MEATFLFLRASGTGAEPTDAIRNLTSVMGSSMPPASPGALLPPPVTALAPPPVAEASPAPALEPAKPKRKYTRRRKPVDQESPPSADKQWPTAPRERPRKSNDGWSPERRAKFARTMAAKGLNVRKHAEPPPPSGHYSQRDTLPLNPHRVGG